MYQVGIAQLAERLPAMQEDRVQIPVWQQLFFPFMLSFGKFAPKWIKIELNEYLRVNLKDLFLTWFKRPHQTNGLSTEFLHIIYVKLE